jgi:hypothetical protein
MILSLRPTRYSTLKFVEPKLFNLFIDGFGLIATACLDMSIAVDLAIAFCMKSGWEHITQ